MKACPRDLPWDAASGPCVASSASLQTIISRMTLKPQPFGKVSVEDTLFVLDGLKGQGISHGCSFPEVEFKGLIRI